MPCSKLEQNCCGVAAKGEYNYVTANAARFLTRLRRAKLPFVLKTRARTA